MTSPTPDPPPLTAAQRSRAIEIRAVREWLMGHGHHDMEQVTPHTVATALRALGRPLTDRDVLQIHDILRDTWQPVVQQAVDAFWAKVASLYPQARTGDLGPVETSRFWRAAQSAIEEWIALNVLDLRDAVGIETYVNDEPGDVNPGIMIDARENRGRALSSSEARALAAELVSRADYYDTLKETP